MKCFDINLNRLANISLLGKEHLTALKPHLTRKTNCFILYLITEGELSILHNDKPLTLKSGDVYLFSEGDTHKPLGSCDCKYYYVHFDADINIIDINDNDFSKRAQKKNLAFSGSLIYGKARYYNRTLLLPEKITINEKIDFNYIANKLEQDTKIFRRLTISENLLLSFDLFKILLKLESIAEHNSTGKSKSMSTTYIIANKIAEFINSHYLEEIDSAIIEKEFMINYDYANHLFKTAIGESIIKYRNGLRIERAKFLLLTTDMRIEEVGVKSGFNDKFYFTRYFTKSTGVSPTHFREAERGNV